jgi:hypothetical protein
MAWPNCGQAIDLRDFPQVAYHADPEQVAYHADPEHDQPLELDA